MPRIKPVLFAIASVAAASVILYVSSDDSTSLALRSQTRPGTSSSTFQASPNTIHSGTDQDELKNRISALQEEVDRLTRENSELRRFKAGATTVLKQSGIKNGEGADEKSNESEDAFSKSVKALASRAAELNQHFQKRPGQDIPELQMLNEGQWLSLAKNANLDTEEGIRAALSDVRKQAKQNFSQMVWNAVTKYSAANNGQSPTDPSQLQSYFETPVDSSVLQRYQVVPTGSIPSLNQLGSFVLSEKAPVDREYDTHFYIGTAGYQQYGVSKNGSNGDPDTTWINR